MTSLLGDMLRRRSEQAVALYKEVATIYFMQCDCPTGFIKIGFGKKPERRLPLLQVGCPYPLKIIATMPGTYADERAMHKRFKDARAQGEWFRPTPELLEFIETLKPTSGAYDVNVWGVAESAGF